MTDRNFATKQDLHEMEARIVKRVTKNVKNSLGKTLGKKIKDSEIKILSELQKMRDEKDAHQFSHMRINDEIADHENRIKTLGDN